MSETSVNRGPFIAVFIIERSQKSGSAKSGEWGRSMVQLWDLFFSPKWTKLVHYALEHCHSKEYSVRLLHYVYCYSGNFNIKLTLFLLSELITLLCYRFTDLTLKLLFSTVYLLINKLMTASNTEKNS